VESTPGHGATFRIDLPGYSPVSGGSSRTVSASPRASRRSRAGA
jgi:hypothetical protein